MNNEVVTASLHNGTAVEYKPRTRMGEERFAQFREAAIIAGAPFDHNLRAHIGSTERAAQGIIAMERRGFAVEIEGTLAKAIADQMSLLRESHSSAAAHVEAMEAEFAQRGLALYPFQRTGARFLSSRDAGIVCDEMGVGKTIQALAALPKNVGVIIVCISAVKYTWLEEMAIWRPDLTPVILKGRKSFRWPKVGEAVILNYEILPPFVKKGRRNIVDPELGAVPQNLVLISDESHKLKNARTQRSQRFKAVSKAVRANAGRVWLLTGTPMQNRPTDLWAVLSAAGLENSAFDSWPTFLRLFGGEKGRFGYDWAERPDATVPTRLKRVMIRRTRAQVLPQLPPKQYQKITIYDIDKNTRNVCDATMQILADAGIELTAATYNADLRSDHKIFHAMSAARAALTACKIKSMMEVVESYEEQDEPLVVFAANRSAVDVLAKREGWISITGSVNPEERQQITRDFRDGKYKGLASTVGAGGTGLTLCGGAAQATHVLMVGREWNPSDNHQAEDRVARVGNERANVHITDLVANHEFDERLYDILVRKTRLIDGSMPLTEEE